MSKIVIFANGPSIDPLENRQYIDPDDIIICADGGAVYARELDIMPHHLVGDFDSLDNRIVEKLRAAGVAIEQHPVNKDKTDLELALETAATYPPQELLVLTGLGGRMDQLLGNINLLAGRAWPFTRISMADGEQRAWVLTGPDAITLAGEAGDVLSVIPFGGGITGLDIIGVKWPLRNKQVSWGSTLTLSNEIIEQQAKVVIKEGIALVIRIKKGAMPMLNQQAP